MRHDGPEPAPGTTNGRPARALPGAGRPLPGAARRPRPTLAEVADRLAGRTAGAGAGATRVAGAAQDSRTVGPGQLWAALPGAHTHGARHSRAAAARGAAAALTDAAGEADVLAAGLPCVVVPDVRAALGPVAGWLAGDPSRHLDLVGVTGTNGKTSTTHLLAAGMAAAGARTGLLSGVVQRAPGWSRPAVRTTPEACDLQRSLAELVQDGVSAAALEVSSHGLALHRVDGTVFRAGVFTNLGRDHLDLHATMESYLAAKARLFEPERCSLAVVNVADPWGRRLADGLRVPVVRFAVAPVDAGGGPAPAGAGPAGADWRADRVVATAAGTRFRLTGPGIRRWVRLRLLGTHQAENALAALAALVSIGIDPDAAVAGVESLAGVPGRLEAVSAGQPFAAYVDYVHNETGQAAVYPFLRSLTGGRLVVVMGATGGRDLGKREPLGRAAGAAADLVVVTDESPHEEDPASIRATVARAARHGGRARVVVEPDRAAAFELAVASAGPGDVVVVCGRGADPVLTGADGSRPFSDREQLLAALRAQSGAWEGATTRSSTTTASTAPTIGPSRAGPPVGQGAGDEHRSQRSGRVDPGTGERGGDEGGRRE